MAIKTSHLSFYMKMAYNVAELSHCKRAKVGAVIVKDDRILSFGYNGTPAGQDNCCEDCEGNTKPSVLHAECNALGKVARSTESAQGATMFITLAPCVHCAKIVVASGIKVVYYNESYRDDTGLQLLKSCGVICTKLEI